MTTKDSAQRYPVDLILVEDSAVDAELVADALGEAGLTVAVRRVEDEPAFRAALDERMPDAILSDWTLPNYSGRRALEFVRERCPEVPFIFVSGTISESSAFEALRQGAIDYVFKHQLQNLAPALFRALNEAGAERSLRESEEKYRKLFESSRDALFVLSPHCGRIIEANHAALQLFEVAGKADFVDLGLQGISPERQPDGCLSTEKAEEMIAIALREGSHFFEWEHQRLSGKTFTADVLLTSTETTGELSLQASVRDISERKRNTEELDRHRHHLEELVETRTHEMEIARAVAEKANLAKSEFLSSMSHELRSPLNVILGFAQLLETDSTPPTPGQQKSITLILQAGWHLLNLINEILDLAKIESGRVPLSPEPVSLAEVILECQGMIGPLAQQRGIHLTVPRFDTPCFVHADRTRLKQVLFNLLSNAIKYNSKQGTVEVDCSESTPGRIRMSVRDTGAGLDAVQMAQLFQSFNRLGQETGSEEGTGIGLVLVKQLVELMGGVVGVESTVGEGSVFWFELNSVAVPHLSLDGGDAAIVAQPQVSREARLHTLLYVEDNPANMKLVEQLIARLPEMRLLSAVNGKSGIEIAHESRPDVILMDINLPGINGFEAMKILRSDPETAHIPVIAISANAMPRDIERGIEAGFFRYITKPIKVDEFMAALDMAREYAENVDSQVA